MATAIQYYTLRFWPLALLLLLAFSLLPALSATADTIQVGPDRDLKRPSEAARIAADGDTVEIDAGEYLNDYAVWRQNNLTIRGVGGMAHLRHADGLIRNGKAIWIIRGRQTVVENMEFSGARVRSTNGAGIRQNGGTLLLRNTYFHHNEFAILSAGNNSAELTIEDSRFAHHRREGRFAHGLYIGAIKKFTLTGSHVSDSVGGHLVKSRALENHILYNRIADSSEGTSARLIDLSNCGLSFIIGNDFYQARSTRNVNAIGYGPEKCNGRSDRQMYLYVINNTLINSARGSNLVRNHAGGKVTVANNLLFGTGRFLAGKGSQKNNLQLQLGERQADSWSTPANSAAVDAAIILPEQPEGSLVPTMMFKLPQGRQPRPQLSPLDIGSRESR